MALLTLGVLLVSSVSGAAPAAAASLPAVASPSPSPADGIPPEVAALSDEAAASAALAAEHAVALSPAVLTELAAQGTTDFWVVFEDRADLSGAAAIEDWARRGEYVHTRLVETAAASQAVLTGGLAAVGVDHTPYWIANRVFVRGGDHSVLDGALTTAGVAEVRAEETVELPDPVAEGDDARIAAVEWGIANIRADQVWAEFGTRGEGIVVGSIDSGVEYTHPALVNQYRGNTGDGGFDHDYNWWDPAGVCPADEPCDNNNHGTHTTGTMVGGDGGENQIGVAPGAQWIAAKGCESSGCSGESLLSAGQFMLAPTDLAGENPDPARRPHIVNNSWGAVGGQSAYDPVVESWVAAGMFPAFANGNDGPACGTAGSPADGPDAHAVGAHGSDNTIADFSSRGPGRGDEIRPHISAPGVDVRSAVVGGYGLGSGTSMATPHLAGTVALMWSASDLVGDIDATRAALDITAIDNEDLTCGGEPGNNNVYGQGRLDAREATVEAAIDSGVTGIVTDAVDGRPLAGVTVAVAGLDRTRTTGDDGEYAVPVEPGTYSLEFSRFGYATRMVPDVAVTAASFTTVDIDLDPLPTGRITGTVTDRDSGHPIPGVSVKILDAPAELAIETDRNGDLEIASIPVGSYQLEATGPGPGWASATVPVEVTEDAVATAEIDLPPLGGVERVTVSSVGLEGNDRSGRGLEGTTVSADGRYVAFHSEATNLVTEPVDEDDHHVYLHDRETGETVLVSVYSGGEPAEGWKPSISADGRHIAFASTANRLVENTPLTGRHVYVRDHLTGSIEMVSVSNSGEPANAISSGSSISGDGRYVTFLSTATNLVEGVTGQQIYVHDRETGTTEVVSAGVDGGGGDGASREPVITPDGRYIAFNSRATDLVPGQVWECREPWEPISCIHRYVYDRVAGEIEWVSTLGPEDMPDGVSPGGAGSHGGISDDGRLVAYHSGGASQLSDDPPNERRAFIYDRNTGEHQLLSPFGADADGTLFASLDPVVSGDGRFVSFYARGEDATGQEIPRGPWVLDRDSGQVELLMQPYDGSPAPTDWHHPLDLVRSLGADGRFALFSTQEDTLLPGDTNRATDAYLIDREFDPEQPWARFAVSGLSVEPAEPLPGEPVEVTVQVANVGDLAGEYEARLSVDLRRDQATTVSLAPGESQAVTWTVIREEGGGHRLDVAHLTGPFRVQSGRLTGQVTDANDRLSVAGATVTATMGGLTRTATTNSAGGYDLGPELGAGTWQVTVEAGRYVAETTPVSIADGERATHDRALRTGVAAVDPEALEATVPTGGMTTVDIKVANAGTADLDWTATAADRQVLVYADDPFHPPPGTYVDQALAQLEVPYTAFYDGDFGSFETALDSTDWDLVIFANEWNPAPQSTYDALHRHVEGGGRLVVNILLPLSHQLWDSVGLQVSGGFFGEPAPVHWWQPDHPVLSDPHRIPELTELESGRCFPILTGMCGPRIELVDGFEALGGFTESVAAGQAGLVIGNDGRTLVRTFPDASIDADLDGSGVPDPVELWVNSITAVGQFEDGVALELSSTSGMLGPDSSEELTLTIDATGAVPGSYRASVMLLTDAAREPRVIIPLSLEVTEPVCDRTITGTRVGPLVVSEGVTCLAEGARVVGPIEVRPGAGLVATAATVTGPVSATGAATVELADSRLTGAVTVSGTTDRLALSGNRVRGPVTLMRNLTGETPIVVSGNRIVGPLSCAGNEPQPVNGGIPNVVTGPTTGQCAGL